MRKWLIVGAPDIACAVCEDHIIAVINKQPFIILFLSQPSRDSMNSTSPAAMDKDAEELLSMDRPQATRFIVKGMSCAGCANGLETKLKEQRGVLLVSVSFPTSSATVKFNAAAVSAETLKAVIESRGYTANDASAVTQTD